mmetsp:Transcript_63596/g.187715  ORF Transcript_63596/g.187715 Transcript_63596/m.187715 type:complete len:92 (+) Transcript_63596:371-646(+)
MDQLFSSPTAQYHQKSLRKMLITETVPIPKLLIICSNRKIVSTKYLCKHGRCESGVHSDPSSDSIDHLDLGPKIFKVNMVVHELFSKGVEL